MVNRAESGGLGLVVVSLVLAFATEARADERGVAYGVAGAEIATGGVIAIHAFTASSPGKGIGLAVNFLPVVVGIGTGILGETQDLDPRAPLGFHGAVIGALPLMALGASFDGRDDSVLTFSCADANFSASVIGSPRPDPRN
jgi:hypothetical protein